MRLRYYLFFPLALIIYACTAQARPLKPVRPTPLPTELFSFVEPEPLQVTFAQIEANPTAYLGQLLRVEASYVALEVVNCYPFQGPRMNWGLVADSLQMGARGYERIVELVPDGVPFTVDGVWRQYAGPAGCGKEPDARVVYYLDVVDIVQPNPISRVYGDAVANVTPLAPTISSEGVVDEPNTISPTATPDTIIDIATLPPTDNGTGYPSEIPTLTPSPTQVVVATNSPPIRATATPSRIDTSTPSPTATQTEVTATATADDSTPTPSPTSESSITETPSPSPTFFTRGTPTATPDGTLTPRPTTTGTPATETPESTPSVTGTPPTATPTVTGTPPVTPDETTTATPSGGIATATTDPNMTPVATLPSDGTPYPDPYP